MQDNTKRLPRLLLAAFVLLDASAVGGLFGSFTGGMYADKPEHAWLEPLGMALGLAGGCITACLWLIVMFHVMSKPRPVMLIRIGAALGWAAGVLASSFLHAALIALTHKVWMIKIAVFGVGAAGGPAGFLVGLAGGLAAWAVIKWGQRHG